MELYKRARASRPDLLRRHGAAVVADQRRRVENRGGLLQHEPEVAHDDGVLFGNIHRNPGKRNTCLGNWDYDRNVYNRNGYTSTKTVIQSLVNIVSKNGNLLLNVPVRGDGTIDEKELAIVEGIAGWMDVNKQCIFATRPWKVSAKARLRPRS